MPEAKLKFNGREQPLGTGLLTIGRTPENDISFPDDQNVSRHHAEIEFRNGEYCLIDLNSSNGTTLNGMAVSGEAYLNDGDKIILGGSSEIVFAIAGENADEKDAEQVNDGATAAQSAGVGTPGGTGVSSSPAAPQVSMTGAAAAGPEAAGSGKMLLIAGAVGGIALVFVVVAAVVYFASGSTCNARAEITSPEPGDTIINPTEIEVNISNSACVARAVFTIDGIEFASSTEEPFTATIDPNEFADLVDGFDHGLAVILEDADGNRIEQEGQVLLAFETRAVTKPTQGTTSARTDSGTQAEQPAQKQASLIEINEMAKNLVKQFPAKNAYNISNRQFLQAVQKMTAEYAVEGYYERAAKYRDTINVSYVREQNLDAPLGFLLAMSRSKFDPAKKGNDEGLWKLSNDFITSNAYNGLCGGESLSDPSQNCAAKSSALYMKAIVFGVFDGDALYSAAVFGKSPQDAGAWKVTLPANRSDIWNTIKTAPEREQIVRFFAAGIVAENPQKFGMKKDRPLSELYRLAM